MRTLANCVCVRSSPGASPRPDGVPVARKMRTSARAFRPSALGQRSDAGLRLDLAPSYSARWTRGRIKAMALEKPAPAMCGTRIVALPILVSPIARNPAQDAGRCDREKRIHAYRQQKLASSSCAQ